MRYRILCVIALVSLCVLVGGVQSGRTQTAGTITGTVTDQSSAVVPSADVVITNSGTGVVARTLKTDSSGIYVAEALPVGTYQVAIEVHGFQRSVHSGISLSVADRLNISFVLNVGAVTQSVEVTAAAPVVETQTGEQSQLITTRQIAEIPILGRNFMLLQQMVPGASKTSGDEMGMGFYGEHGFAINGLNPQFTGYMLDGVWNTQQGNQTSTDVNVGPDNLAEFKVLTSNYSAKYGIAGGGNILAVTKSGTSNFHGNLWEYVRNDKMNAADFFLNKNGLQKSPFRYNDYGYNIGGPFYIPNHYNTDKSKTFFFWSQEWRKRRSAAPILAATPTVAMRNGDFTGYGPLTNPTNPQTGLPMVDGTGTPCVGGAGMDQINPNCINNNMSLLFEQLFPKPNAPGFYNFAQGASSGENWREDFIRVDQNISSKVRVFVRYIQDAWKESDPLVAWSGDAFPTVHNTFNVPSKNIIVKLTATLSPTLLNEFSVNYGAAYGPPTPPAMEILGAPDLPAGYTGKRVFNNSPNDHRVPDLSFTGGWGGIDTMWGAWWAHQGMYEYADDLTKQWRSHSFQLGAIYLWSLAPVDTQTKPHVNGTYSFSGSFTGHPIADAVLGLPASYGELNKVIQPLTKFHQFETYFQDDWKVNRRLTLNLGIRWFYIPHAYSVTLSMFQANKYDPAQAPTVNPDGTIVPGSGNLLNGIVQAGKDGIPMGLVQNHYKSTFGPRLGFAWDPTGGGKTAIRGGYGMGYYRIEGNDVQRMAGNPPGAAVATFFQPPFDDPAGGTAAPLTPLSVNGLDPVYEIPYSMNWSFSVQRELARDLGLSVAYVGSRSVHRDMVADINQPLPAMGYDFDPRIACTPTTEFPCAQRVSRDYVRPYQGWSALSTTIPVGTSIYHSLQVTLQKKLSHGLSFGAAYTWSKAISTCTGSSLDGCTQNYYNLAAERGLASFDRPHMLVMNYVYDIPVFKGMTGVGGAVLKGWEATGLVTLQSGMAMTPGYSSATAGLATRPDRVADVDINDAPKTVDKWFNTAAFTAAPFGHFGNAGDGIIRGPGMNNWDVGFFKNFRIKERGNVQFRAEMFNGWNHTNFYNVNLTYGSGGFGQVNSAHNPRIVQLALRLSF